MSDCRVHLPAPKGRPACGVRRGVMTLEIVGLRKGVAGGVDVSQATQPLVSCRRCLDAMLGFGSPVIRQRWRFWLASAVAGSIPNGADGCTYVARVWRDDDAGVT